jgi:hypothetical protein
MAGRFDKPVVPLFVPRNFPRKQARSQTGSAHPIRKAHAAGENKASTELVQPRSFCSRATF